jgi:hypothetical protein
MPYPPPRPSTIEGRIGQELRQFQAMRIYGAPAVPSFTGRDRRWARSRPGRRTACGNTAALRALPAQGGAGTSGLSRLAGVSPFEAAFAIRGTYRADISFPPTIGRGARDEAPSPEPCFPSDLNPGSCPDRAHGSHDAVAFRLRNGGGRMALAACHCVRRGCRRRLHVHQERAYNDAALSLLRPQTPMISPPSQVREVLLLLTIP